MALELIGSVRLTNNTSGIITFDNIPNDGKDLIAYLSIKTSESGARNLFIRINGITSYTYSEARIYHGNYTSSTTLTNPSSGASSSAASYGLEIMSMPRNGSSTFGAARVLFPNYSAGAGSRKTFIGHIGMLDSGGTVARMSLGMGSIDGVGAISRVDFMDVNYNFGTDSVLSLYKTTA